MDTIKEVPGISTVASNSSHSDNGRKNLDEAYYFIEKSKDVAGESAPVDLSKVQRKVDWRIVPIMFLCYTVAYIDRTLLNYAAVMGLNEDLKLRGNAFSNAASAFFIAYLVAEIPNGYFLQMVSPRKWLAGNTLLWGIATGCTAAAQNYPSLLAARIFLGIFEAAIAPSQMAITSQWYTKSEQAVRASFWFNGIGAGLIFGGLLSWAFQQAESVGFASWRIMFLALGGITLVTALLTYAILPDTPMTACFLSTPEKIALLRHVSVNRTGIKNKHFKWQQLFEMFTDVQIWLITFLTILAAIPTGVVSLYSATLLRNAGFSPDLSALLLMPQGIMGIIGTTTLGFFVRRTSQRGAAIVTLAVLGVLGSALLSFLPSSNYAGLLAGIYILSAITPTLFLIFQWTASNVAGLTKRSITLALVAASFSAGSVIAPQTFQQKDAPEYLPAKLASLASQCAVMLLATALFCYYVWANKRKDRKSGELEGPIENQNEQQMWEDLTDKKNPAFRYVY